MILYKKIVGILKRKKLTISIAESCTGGMLSSAFTSVNGSSKVFSMGLVTYSNQAKVKILNISKKTIAKYGAVSNKVCLMMVNNLSKISKSKICVSTTGIAGPKGGSKNKPIGLVYVGVKNKGVVIIKKYIFKNYGRSFIQKQTVKKTLELLIKSII